MTGPESVGTWSRRDAQRRAYAEFVRHRAPGRGDPFYTEEIVRFELRDDDVLVFPEDVRIESAGSGVVIASGLARGRVEIGTVSPDVVRRIASLADGVRTVRDLRARFSGPELEWVIHAAFGKLLFAPLAVMDLERQLSAREIVRYPGSPYEVVRSYWENAIDVSRRLGDLSEAARDPTRLLSLLIELHSLALMGASGTSFYRPASPIVQKTGLSPGEFFEEPPVLDETGPEVVFVSGPRVGARLIGGPRFQELFAELLEDPGSKLGSLTFTGPNDLPWGRVVTARAATDSEAAPWFCPPRPILPAHVEAIRSGLAHALYELDRGHTESVVQALAKFHQAFLRLHPFAAGNQSVAMSIVNHVLRAALGAGIPHLVLDHVALRLSEPAYGRVFRLAIEGWLVREGTAAERTRRLLESRRAVFELFKDLSETATLDEARTLVRSHRAAARLALLDVE